MRPELVQLLAQRPVSRTPRMSTDATEFVVKSVQVFAQEAHYLHAVIAVLTQKLQKLFARNKSRRRLVARLGGDPILFPSHALAQPKHGSRTDDLVWCREALYTVRASSKPPVPPSDRAKSSMM